MTDCVFCPDNWANLDIVRRDHAGTDGRGDVAIIRPLDPVILGHVLVIHSAHSADAAESPMLARDLMWRAAWYIKQQGIQANIITSVGPAATQTVMHTHLHVVPRRPGDNLPLPWTPQHEVKSLEQAVSLKRFLQESGGDHTSVGTFQQSQQTWWPGEK